MIYFYLGMNQNASMYDRKLETSLSEIMVKKEELLCIHLDNVELGYISLLCRHIHLKCVSIMLIFFKK